MKSVSEVIMAIISDVNGKVAILGSGRFETYQSRIGRRRTRHRLKYIGGVLSGKKLFYDMRKPGNFHDIAEAVRWTGRN